MCVCCQPAGGQNMNGESREEFERDRMGQTGQDLSRGQIMNENERGKIKERAAKYYNRHKGTASIPQLMLEFTAAENAAQWTAVNDLLAAAKAVLYIFDRDLPDESIGRRKCDKLKAAVEVIET